jgi:hypothetical protein
MIDQQMPLEVEAGNVLIPKNPTAPFRSHPNLPQVLPFLLGENVKHAVKNHQWHGQYHTRGVSCTPKWGIALYYALTTNIIVRIDEAKCNHFGIRFYRVRDWVPSGSIPHPEDEEIILVSDINGALPKEIVTAVFNPFNLMHQRQIYCPKNF